MHAYRRRIPLGREFDWAHGKFRGERRRPATSNFAASRRCRNRSAEVGTPSAAPPRQRQRPPQEQMTKIGRTDVRGFVARINASSSRGHSLLLANAPSHFQLEQVGSARKRRWEPWTSVRRNCALKRYWTLVRAWASPGDYCSKRLDICSGGLVGKLQSGKITLTRRLFTIRRIALITITGRRPLKSSRSEYGRKSKASPSRGRGNWS